MALTPHEIRARLPQLSGWQYDGSQITRSYKWPSFQAAIAFVDRLAVEADKAKHHPDIDIRYDTVRVALTTHDDGGVTDKDFTLAAIINRLADA